MAEQHVVRLTGLVTTGYTPGEAPERRIVARLCIPLDGAHALWTDLADELRVEDSYGCRRYEIACAQLRDKSADN